MRLKPTSYRTQKEEIPSGLSTLKIALSLASTSVRVVFENSFESEFPVTKTTDSNGVLTIDLLTELHFKLLHYTNKNLKLWIEVGNELYEFEDHDGWFIEPYHVVPTITQHTINLSGEEIEEPEETGIFDLTFDNTFS